MILIDASSGISGNMILGAFLDIGIDKNSLVSVIKSATDFVGQCRVNINEVKRTIKGTLVSIEFEKKRLTPDEIYSAVDNSNLKKIAKKLAKKMLDIIFKTESVLHGKRIPHLHELGAIDLIADIVGCSYCAVESGYPDTEFYTTPVNVGGGSVETEHGRLPVPAPATLEILRSYGIPFFYSIKSELSTPTGVAVIAALGCKAQFDEIIAEKVGYGFGDREFKNFNSFTRIIAGDIYYRATDICIETNVDDVTGEILGYTMEKLFENGALDVSFIPAYMKKNRPGTIVRIISTRDKLDKLTEILFRELGTFGVRYYKINKKMLYREFENRYYEGEEVLIKKGIDKGNIIRESVEYEDAKKIASKRMIPLRKIYEALEK